MEAVGDVTDQLKRSVIFEMTPLTFWNANQRHVLNWELPSPGAETVVNSCPIFDGELTAKALPICVESGV
jgi:hypothetical protein